MKLHYTNIIKEVNAIRKSLINYRKALGFTQEELSQAIGVTTAYYSLIETGKRQGTIKFWLKLQETLFISDSDLLKMIKEH